MDGRSSLFSKYCRFKLLIGPLLLFVSTLTLLSMPSPIAEAKDPKDSVISSSKAPLMANGGEISEADKGDVLKRKFNIPAPGVYYVWIRVTSLGNAPSIVQYELTTGQPLKSLRREYHIPPYLKSQWLVYTRHPDFRAQVHVDRPGVYELILRHTSKGGATAQHHGSVIIEKIALTPYFSVKPAGDGLDHSEVPGRGRLDIPADRTRPDGYNPSRLASQLKAGGTAWYIDARDGDDSADGRTGKTSWRTFRNVNGRVFGAGDAILLRRGREWKESLTPSGSGTEGKWITIGDYGPVKEALPLVNGVTSHAVRLEGQSYWEIRNLAVTSDPAYSVHGINAGAGKAEPQPRGIRIINCVSYDNGGFGIFVGGGNNGFDGVLIENCLSFWNGGSGIEVSGETQDGCRNTVIRRCTAYGNRGMAGIWINGGQNGLIEHCLAYSNVCFNIWTWNSRNVTIQYCEAAFGHESDAGGFDLDWNSSATVIQYCYSHHNEGCGYLLEGWGDGQYNGFSARHYYSLCRYNISEEDGAGICLSGSYENGLVQNNTVFSQGKGRAAMRVDAWPVEPWSRIGGGVPAGNGVFNNILMAAGGAVPLYVEMSATETGNAFDNNIYWRTGPEGPLIQWAGLSHPPRFWWGEEGGEQPPIEYKDMQKFREATGQEASGLSADPLLVNPGEGGWGRRPLQAYTLRPDTPAKLRGRQAVLTPEWLAERRKLLENTGAEKYGIPMDPVPVDHDYWERKVRSLKEVSIGAYQ